MIVFFPLQSRDRIGASGKVGESLGGRGGGGEAEAEAGGKKEEM